MAEQNEYGDVAVTVTSGGLTAYSQAMVNLLTLVGANSPWTLVKMGLIGSLTDIASVGAAVNSGNSYEVGKAFFSGTFGAVFGAAGGALGGDLGYRYAQAGDFAGVWLSGVQATLADSRFGLAAQSLQNSPSGIWMYDLELG